MRALGPTTGIKKCIHNFGQENLEETYHLEEPEVGGRIILKRILKRKGEGYRLYSGGSE